MPWAQEHQGTIIHQPFQSLNFPKIWEECVTSEFQERLRAAPSPHQIRDPFLSPRLSFIPETRVTLRNSPRKNVSWDMALSLSIFILGFPLLSLSLFIFIVDRVGGPCHYKTITRGRSCMGCQPWTLVASVTSSDQWNSTGPQLSWFSP